MIVTAELSLYPLVQDYEEAVIAFIKTIKGQAGVEVHTHSMSTFVKGGLKDVMNAIEQATKTTEGTPVSMVMKMINRDLPVEKGFLEFN